MKKMLMIFIAIVLLLFTGCTGSTNREEDLKEQAWICAQNVVRENLKSPSSAKFCWYPEADISNLGDNEYMIRGWVEAQNDFGVSIKTDFIVTLELTARGYKNGYVTFD